ncbi:MAG TPA: hypothetical protein VG755_00105 [Nannocystaceae bacterium]|nr:hypothetical protein [Nannocystaceae bacterium]
MPNAWWQQMYPWWPGPVVDPPPWYGGGGWGGNGGFPWPGPVVDPAPWPQPTPRPIPRPWPGPQVDPSPEDFTTRPWRRFPFPLPWPGDPAPWFDAIARGGVRQPEPSPWGPFTDPSPEDILHRVRIFQRYLEDILAEGGFPGEHVGKATVKDVVEAYRVASTPRVARAEGSAITAAQIAALDDAGLERLHHHLQGEVSRLGALAETVKQRIKKAGK